MAIKIVPIEGTELSELKKEISILKQCSSPFIVQYYGSYIHDTDMWIVMEYCDAGSVADCMTATLVPLRENEIAAIVANIILGLEYLHGQNSIHRVRSSVFFLFYFYKI